MLILGATGFLGGWLTKRLIDEGARVHCLVRGRKRKSQFFLGGLAEKAHVVDGAAEDQRAIDALFASDSLDAVFHLASLVDVNAALQRPLEMFQSSVDSTLRILEHVRQRSQQTAVIVASSDKAYGSQPLPFQEDKPLQPAHPYEVAKAAQDLLTQFYGKVHKLNTAVTRCGNFFGGWDFAFERIIPFCIREALFKRAPVLRSDGKFTRDFLYMEEAVNANLLLARKVVEEPGLRGEAFNFSHEVDIEIGQLAEMICQKLDPSLRPIFQGITKAEIRQMRLDTSKAKTILGWQAELDFDEGLDRTIAWYRQNRSLWSEP